MSKMGQELHELLGKHRYEMWEALKELVMLIDDYQEGSDEIDSYTTQPAKNVLAKIEPLDLRDRKELEDLKAMR